MAVKKSKFIILKNRIKKLESGNPFFLSLHKLYISTTLRVMGPEKFTILKFKSRMGKDLDLKNPQSFNEKIQWLKLFYFQPFYRKCCDKYLVRDYLIEKLGKDIEPELLFVTQKPEEFSVNKIKCFPCILKISNGSGQNLIINSRDEYTDEYLRKEIKLMIYEANLNAKYGIEPQYLPDNPYIVVEKLLQTKEGKLPNDYKLIYINGELQFVYCSVDRSGANVRHMYDKDWNRMNAILLENATQEVFDKYMSTPSVECPKSFNKMKEIGDILSKDFPLVRLDFYDADGELYFGEVTLHHGGGFDRFYPEELDYEYGKKIVLPEKNYKVRI